MKINVHQLTYNSFIMRNRKNNVKKPMNAHKDLYSLAKNLHDQGKTTELEPVMATVKERRYKEYEEFDKFHTDRDIAEGHITISETKRLEELEKLAMEEIMAKYVNYSTMASEEHLFKCRDAVEEIIAKYVTTPPWPPWKHQSSSQQLIEVQLTKVQLTVAQLTVSLRGLL